MFPYIIAVLCVCLFLLHRRNRQKWAGLDKIPGPAGIPFIGNLLDISPDQKKSLDGLYDMSQQYDGIFKMNLGPLGRTVLISDPKYFEQMVSHVHKGGWYTLLNEWLGNGMVLTNGHKWRNSRKLISPVFSTKVLEGFCHKFEQRNKQFVTELKQMGPKSFNIHHLIHRNSFLQMFNTLIGGEVRDDHLKTYLTNSAKIIQISTNRFFSLKVFDFIFKLSKDNTVMKDALHAVRSVIKSLIEARRVSRKEKEIKSDKKAFLDILLDIQDDNPDIPDLDIIQQIDTFMFAGHDTVAVALGFAIYELCRNKDIQEKLYKETIEVFGDDLAAEVTLKQLESAEYLDMFCKETLRKYPSAPMISREIIEPLKLGEFEIPIGTSVILLIYSMQRTPKHFADPLKFDPERFSPDNKDSTSEYAFATFGHGIRNCIGKRFALLEMKSTLVMLVRSFIFEKGHADFEVSIGQAGILIPLNGILVRTQERC